MKNVRKKIGIGIVLIAMVILGILIYNNISVETEYNPEQDY